VEFPGSRLQIEECSAHQGQPPVSKLREKHPDVIENKSSHDGKDWSLVLGKDTFHARIANNADKGTELNSDYYHHRSEAKRGISAKGRGQPLEYLPLYVL
jgi:hypothetical protein